MAEVKLSGAAILAIFLFTVVTLAQSPMWRAEGHDVLLVAPGARDVRYIHAAPDLLTYRVEVEYPATDVVAVICGELEQKGWHPLSGCPGENEWKKFGPGGTMPYRWQSFWSDNNGNYVNYYLEYDEPAKRGRTPRTLKVQAYFVRIPPTPPQNPAESQPKVPLIQTAAYRIAYKIAINLVGFGLVLATVLALRSPKVNSVVFYLGPDSWMTSLNLVFFGPVAAAFFAFDALILIQQFGNAAEVASIAAGIAAVGLMWLIGKISLVPCAVVLFLTYSMLSARNIPGNVKKVHCALNLASLAFFGCCGYLAYFADQPLFHW